MKNVKVRPFFSFVLVKIRGGGKTFSKFICYLGPQIRYFYKGSYDFGPDSTYSHEKKPHFFIWLKSKSVFDLIKSKVDSVVN